MAKKKDGKSIILPTPVKPADNDLWDTDEWDEDEDEGEWDMDDMDEMSQQLLNAMFTKFISGSDGGGMTNEQYKGMLLDQLENWKRVKRTAEEEGAKKTAAEIQAHISVINRKLKF